MCITLTEAIIAVDVPGYRSYCNRTVVPRSKSGRSWVCGSGEHHYHRIEHIAKFCAPAAWVRPQAPEVEAALRLPSPRSARENQLVRMFEGAH